MNTRTKTEVTATISFANNEEYLKWIAVMERYVNEYNHITGFRIDRTDFDPRGNGAEIRTRLEKL